ncbi:unnamed protein product [Zymoseptoria tritici ST99CH_3D7]|uniref:Uncharacterized protein n=2 Tax=Zymoseptoria tritici TaxID=1047171 RepID=A0A1X7RDW5_ZYMT9|nr:unnamed protein product [Zymoseptoria tritici ST99CH_3D7]
MAAQNMAKKTITLVTGGNGGIGFEVVSQLMAASNNHVLLGARSIEKGSAAVKDLESRKLAGTVELLKLDVSDEQSIENAAKQVEEKHGRIDGLVNNAAISQVEGLPLSKQMAICYQTNVIGVQLMGENFAPLLKKSSGTPRIVNVSSGVGSITQKMDPKSRSYDLQYPQYRASKAALNMITACQCREYRDDGFKIFAYCPGFTVSNLSSMNVSANGAKPTSEGAAPIVALLRGDRDGDHGKFVHATGEYAW